MEIGIGFVTGRKLFKRTLNTYINNWIETKLIENKSLRFHVFVVYDTSYQNIPANSFKNIAEELLSKIDSIHYFGEADITEEINFLAKQNIISANKSELLFGNGYGRKRNFALYQAIRHKMDKMIFLDDDEYPVATHKNIYNKLMWRGQSVVGTHLDFNKGDVTITHGHHCGYISPIPMIKYNKYFKEEDFKNFIEAVSNDILSWEKISRLTYENFGVTYADEKIIDGSIAAEVKEEKGMKFISGANLCINLNKYSKLPCFYNPPYARGEDTFMSTCLSNLKVLKVPCYTFHDGFGYYKELLSGVLPTSLEGIKANSDKIIDRFCKAAIGWARYKPLLSYITNRANFESEMDICEQKLEKSVPLLAKYFEKADFHKVYTDFRTYRKVVEAHFNEFTKTQSYWYELVNKI